ncbi:MAG: lipid-A-disaccharide synthase [Legionellales bacterium]|nr:lipid-A-disaccharide synthase [Legionellales bacterium]
MRFCIVAGEASGDILGADLIQALKKCYPDAVFEGIAGARMQAAGCRSLFPMETLSVMGLFEVLRHLPSILSVHRRLVRYLKKNPPTVYIGIDAPDTNLRIAKKIQSTGIKVVHYVSPSVWAWRQKRVKTIAQTVDLMLTLFPFEAKFYQQHDIPARCVGHALADVIPLEPDRGAARDELGLSHDVPVLALLAGSREGEVARHAPIFLRTAKACMAQLPSLQFVAPMANQARAKQFEHLWQTIAPELPIKIVLQNSGLALSAADTVLTVSGTATLEAMLYKRNMIVAYRISALTFFVAKFLVKFRYMALPNLLADKRLVPEFLQDDVHETNLARLVLYQLTQPASFIPVAKTFLEIHQTLKQNAGEVAAEEISALLKNIIV